MPALATSTSTTAIALSRSLVRPTTLLRAAPLPRASCSVRPLSTSHGQRPRSRLTPARVGLGVGATSLAVGGLFLPSQPASPGAATTEGQRHFSIHSPAEEEAKGGEVKGSSTIWRKASPAAPRRQTVTLVFVSDEENKVGLGQVVKSLTGGVGGRAAWQPFIAYFRESGYDALDLNLSSPTSSSTPTSLADELHAQLRLASLQRLPVLFVRDGSAAADAVAQYIHPSSTEAVSWWRRLFSNPANARPAISGLIVVESSSQGATKFGSNPKLNVLVVGAGSSDWKQGKITALDTKGKRDEEVIKAVERWLIDKGYEG